MPGLIRTYGIIDELPLERGRVVPLADSGDLDVIAGPTVSLASEDARCITGSCSVDGGALVQPADTPQVGFELPAGMANR